MPDSGTDVETEEGERLHILQLVGINFSAGVRRRTYLVRLRGKKEGRVEIECIYRACARTAKKEYTHAEPA